MRRLVGVLAVALLTVAVPAMAGQATKEKAADAKKLMTAMGTVAAVTQTSLTVKSKTGDMVFDIDSATKVTAPGATTKTNAMKAEKKSTTITDFVKVGDMATVGYHDMGTSKHAATVKVTKSPAK